MSIKGKILKCLVGMTNAAYVKYEDKKHLIPENEVKEKHKKLQVEEDS